VTCPPFQGFLSLQPEHVVTQEKEDNSLAEAQPDPSAHRYKLLGLVASLLIVSGSAFVLWQLVRDVEWGEVVAAFKSVSSFHIGMAILFTAISYAFLTAYDALALKQLRIRLPYPTAALGSFTSYAVSFNLGFPLLTGGAVRYRIYASKGLSAGRIASLTVIAGITFWLGMGVVLSWSLIREAVPLSSYIGTKANINLMIGLGLLAAVISYFIWVSLKRRSVTMQGWRLELPGFRLSVAQTLIGAADICCAATVLYVLLPANNALSYELFLAIYVVAVMLGVASHVPGGLGVFETIILKAMSGAPLEPTLGALLLFRICYYFVPFFLALILLGIHEARERLARRTLQG
jgi:glycosyltransferase 2 family protein